MRDEPSHVFGDEYWEQFEAEREQGTQVPPLPWALSGWAAAMSSASDSFQRLADAIGEDPEADD